MKKLLSLAALPFLVGVAMAQPAQLTNNQQPVQQPMQLTNNQMDTVSAGFALHEIDISNTSWTELSVYGGPLLTCDECFLRIVTPTISVQSKFGPEPPVQPSP